mgnify:CR=1 FL=1
MFFGGVASGGSASTNVRAKMKRESKKQKKNIMFFDFSNHAGAQVPIFTPKMKKMEFARPARFARLSTRKWDFRRRSRPRELTQRSQDDVSLNKLPQITDHFFQILRSRSKVFWKFDLL